MKRFGLIFTIVALTTSVAHATTWVSVEKIDPIGGDSVTVHEIVTSGTYIYRWPSKVDVIFWPMTDWKWLWTCPKSGYTAFAPDFEKLTDDEEKGITKWLAENYDPEKPPKTFIDRLLLAEKIYALRDMDDDFTCRFHRLLAYLLASTDDQEGSLARVRLAMPLLRAKLEKNPKGQALVETVYLLGEYNRRLGETEKARAFFKRIQEMTPDPAAKLPEGLIAYFQKLVADQEKKIGDM